MTPERALLDRMLERLAKAANKKWPLAVSAQYALGHCVDAGEHYAWLTAEMATLGKEA